MTDYHAMSDAELLKIADRLADAIVEQLGQGKSFNELYQEMGTFERVYGFDDLEALIAVLDRKLPDSYIPARVSMQLSMEERIAVVTREPVDSIVRDDYE